MASTAAIAPAPADDASGVSPEPASAPAQKATEQRSSGKRRITFEDEFLVEGHLEKPSAYFILQRSHADYDWARLEVKFLPLVLESVQDPLF